MLAMVVPAAAGAYPWPLRPFYEPHAVRGYFNDPRVSGMVTSFHHGIDIYAKDFEPVYSVEPGRVTARGQTVSVAARVRTLSYWHVLPVVRTGQRVHRHQLIGHIAPGAEHLHLSEIRGGTYVNPLRLGAVAPYVDDTVPQLPSAQFYIAGEQVQRELVTGEIDVTVDAYDINPLPLPPAGWEQTRLAPAEIRWRVVRGDEVFRAWERAVDFRTFLMPPNLFDFVYAPGTYQNRMNRPGRYEYYLSRDFNTRTLPNGSYVLEVEAWDVQHNVGLGFFSFTVTNG